MTNLSLEESRNIIAADEEEAQRIGVPMNIAVADSAGHLLAHVRMDGALLGSIDISIKKPSPQPRSACLRMPSGRRVNRNAPRTAYSSPKKAGS